MQTKSGIYCFENKINGKKYIGQACDLYRRLRSHKTDLSRGVDKCFRLQRAVNKYGLENFHIYFLEICDESMLDEREIYWISKFQTNNWNYGYNVSTGGSSGLMGYKHSPETIRRLSEMRKGTHLSDEHKQRISEGNKGKILTEEHRKRISERQQGEKHFMWGKHHTDESKKKIGRAGQKSFRFGTKKPGASSNYFGVRRLVQKGFIYWQASIKIYQQNIYIGMSKVEEEAARMYDAYVIKHNLPNPLNFSEEQ